MGFSRNFKSRLLKSRLLKSRLLKAGLILGILKVAGCYNEVKMYPDDYDLPELGPNVGKSIVIKPEVTAPHICPANLDPTIAPADAPRGFSTLIQIENYESRIITVTLSDFGGLDNLIHVVGPPAGTAIARPTAILEWGSDGIQDSAEIDFLHGFTFSVGAQFLRVIGKNGNYDNGSLVIVPGYARNVLLGAHASYGNGPSKSYGNARFTEYVNDPVAAPGLQIPSFANKMAVYSTDPANNVLVSIFDEGGTGIYSYTQVAGQIPLVYELSNDANFLQLTNPVGGPISQPCRLVYGLSL